MQSMMSSGFIISPMLKSGIVESTRNLGNYHRHTISTKSIPLYSITEFSYLASRHVKGISEESKKLLNEFLFTLSLKDTEAILSAIEEINNYSFVERIDFEICEIPLIVIKLSDYNRENKSKIYEIEYNLLREIEADIDFYIRPF